eukprot:Lithocolla_globosa_v1_NODE_2619_length_1930_cov_39.573867.p1 type:complete len:560 gc:universal NODE_2619_length_1930_cov_39.573867:45-1724(+)
MSRTTRQQAELATCRRLISAFVSEGFVKCTFIGLPEPHVKLEPLTPANVTSSISPVLCAILPAAYQLILNTVYPDGQDPTLDPEDIPVCVFPTIEGQVCTDPCQLLDHVGPWFEQDIQVLQLLREELASSVDNQEQGFLHYPSPPDFGSGLLVWERSIVEGHATHPMHKTRIGMTLEQAKVWTNDGGHPVTIRFISMPSSQMKEYGGFSSFLKGWLPVSEQTDRVIIPIHPGQWRYIQERFPDAILLPEVQEEPENYIGYAQASVRTISVPKISYDLKFSYAVQTTSALRTVSPYSVYNGPILGQAAEAVAPPTLHVIHEIASMGSLHDDPDVAKHLGCLIRQDVEKSLPDETLILACGLVEKDSQGVAHVLRVFNLQSQQQRLDFYRKYCHLSLLSFLPSVFKGLAFEAHGQNSICRFNSQTKELIGFAYRDFGGVRFLPSKFQASTGLSIQLKPGSAPLADSMDDLWHKFVHTLFQHHLHRLIRALDLHYSGEGWAITRQELEKVCEIQDKEHPKVYNMLVAPVSDFKCLLKMRMEGKYRDYLFRPIPNVLWTGSQP